MDSEALIKENSCNLSIQLFRRRAIAGNPEVSFRSYNVNRWQLFCLMNASEPILRWKNTIYSLSSDVMYWNHWGWVTNICFSELTIIGSNNGLSPARRQAIIWTIAGVLLIGPLGTNFIEILIEDYTFYSGKYIWICRQEIASRFVSVSMSSLPLQSFMRFCSIPYCRWLWRFRNRRPWWRGDEDDEWTSNCPITCNVWKHSSRKYHIELTWGLYNMPSIWQLTFEMHFVESTLWYSVSNVTYISSVGSNWGYAIAGSNIFDQSKWYIFDLITRCVLLWRLTLIVIELCDSNE